MTELNVPSLKNHLSERRARLNETIKYAPEPDKLYSLLQQVDSALERIDKGSFGICDVCHDPIEEDRLIIDPLITVCLDHLSHHQRKALEQDLEFAIKIQQNLLPENNVTINGWEFSYRYIPAATVSGDFCDFVKLDDDSVLFVLGDVSGKGISASLMMSHLHALIRSLLSFNLPLNEIVTRVNRLFCESTISTHYATMIFGRANKKGEVELCIAGHNPPLLRLKDKVINLNSTGIPIGLFCQSEFESINLNLQNDDFLILYTDGLIEISADGNEYEQDRLKSILSNSTNNTASCLIDEIIQDQVKFLGNSPRFDDTTVAIVKKV